MSDRHDLCERCGTIPYYDGHKDWCNELTKLEEKMQSLIEKVDELTDNYNRHYHRGHFPRHQPRL